MVQPYCQLTVQAHNAAILLMLTILPMEFFWLQGEGVVMATGLARINHIQFLMYAKFLDVSLNFNPHRLLTEWMESSELIELKN